MTCDYSKLPVVVVEGNRPSRSLADSLLALKGISNRLLHVAGDQLIGYLQEHEAAAIILQLDLPISAGLHLLKQITAGKPQTAIVIITEVNQIDTAVECIKLGAFDYLTKPITADRLLESIKKALDFRCLEKVASLLRDTPCLQSCHIASDETIQSAPVPLMLPDDIPDRIRKAVNYLERNSDKPLSLECVAQQARLSKYHFSREFKKHIGISPIRFMMNRRICQATLLLQNRELTISSVATRTGFYDQSEFTKWFKKATGFTPSWYRRSFATKE
jgi:AraC family transcriptional regulator